MYYVDCLLPECFYLMFHSIPLARRKKDFHNKNNICPWQTHEWCRIVAATERTHMHAAVCPFLGHILTVNSFSYCMADFSSHRVWIKAVCLQWQSGISTIAFTWTIRTDSNSNSKHWDETVLPTGPDERLWFGPASLSMCTYNLLLWPYRTYE